MTSTTSNTQHQNSAETGQGFKPRPHQTECVAAIMAHIGKGRKRGLVIHTQGSGKTHTMFMAAQEIAKTYEASKVIILVDRTDIGEQHMGHADNVMKNAYGSWKYDNMKNCLGLKRVNSGKDLLRLLKNDGDRILVSTIQKFHTDIPAMGGSDNMFILVDEAHRSQGNNKAYGKRLRKAFPQCTYLGFTGTPICAPQSNQDTFEDFNPRDGSGDTILEEPIHVYTQGQSLSDGATLDLKIVHMGATLTPMSKKSINRMEVEAMSSEDASMQELEGGKAYWLMHCFGNKGRIARIAQYIYDDQKRIGNPNGAENKFMIVATNRKACAKYYEAMAEHFQKEEIAVVFSSRIDDGVDLTRHKKNPAQVKEVCDSFKQVKGGIRILIVTNKLTTGFDAPIMHTLYLDKVLRGHSLGQCVARVVRPCKEVGKKEGRLVDFTSRTFGDLAQILPPTDIGIVQEMRDKRGERKNNKLDNPSSGGAKCIKVGEYLVNNISFDDMVSRSGVDTRIDEESIIEMLEERNRLLHEEKEVQEVDGKRGVKGDGVIDLLKEINQKRSWLDKPYEGGMNHTRGVYAGLSEIDYRGLGSRVEEMRSCLGMNEEIGQASQNLKPVWGKGRTVEEIDFLPPHKKGIHVSISDMGRKRAPFGASRVRH